MGDRLRPAWRKAALIAVLLSPIPCDRSPIVFAEEAAFPPEAQQVTQKLAAITSYRARFTLEAKEESVQLFRLEGTLLFKMPAQRRLEIRQPGSKGEPQRVVSDGKIEWQSYPEGGVVYRITNPPEAPGPHRPFSEVQPGTMKFSGAQETGDGKVLRFEAKPLPKSVDGSPVPIEKVRIDVAEKDGLARGMVLLDAKGDAVMTQHFFGVELNVPVSDKEFSYTPKEGVAVMDVPVQTGTGQ